MFLETVYIAFYKADKGTLLDKLISTIDGSIYSHCELVIDYSVVGKSTCISSSHRDGGLRQKDIDLNDGKWDLIPVGCDVDFAQSWYEINKPMLYDYVGLITTKIDWFPQINNRVFCSEACAIMLKLNNQATYGIKEFANYCLDSVGGRNE